MKVLILGASGLVGRHVLASALAHPAVTQVVAPTRKPLAPHTKLINPVDNNLRSQLTPLPMWEINSVICSLGTTMAKAGSRTAFLEVDYSLPLEFAKAARASGATVLGLVTAIGASPDSRFFYAKTKGQLERDVTAIGYPSLTIVRPSIIGGERNESRLAEGIVLRLSTVLSAIIPKKFRVSTAPRIAAALIDAIILQPPGCHYRLAESLS